MNLTLENERLRIGVKSKGAELFSVFDKENQLEYMWSGDPAFWGKTSPVLFPIVGTLKDDTFVYQDKKYLLSRHGFARDAEFELLPSENNALNFLIRSNSESLLRYPFHFQLAISYVLEGNLLKVLYTVENKGEEKMYFSLGAHPAFKVPLISDTPYNDHYLHFNKIETAPRWPISGGGLIESDPTPFLNNSDTIKLDKSLFAQDAIVLKHLASDRVSLRCSTHTHGFDFIFEGFPYLGIWAAKNADFVCIEPWCGIADSVNHTQELVSKEGIETVNPAESWSRMWKVEFY